MGLSEEKRKQIEEEESYRAMLRDSHSAQYNQVQNKKKGIGCGRIIIIGLIFFLGAGILITALSSSNIIKSSTTPQEIQKPDLTGNVQFTGTQFEITNSDNFPYENCHFELNGQYFLSPPDIYSGEVYTVGAANFATKNGARFDPFSIKPIKFVISCKSTSQTSGFGYWEWQ